MFAVDDTCARQNPKRELRTVYRLYLLCGRYLEFLDELTPYFHGPILKVPRRRSCYSRRFGFFFLFFFRPNAYKLNEVRRLRSAKYARYFSLIFRFSLCAPVVWLLLAGGTYTTSCCRVYTVPRRTKREDRQTFRRRDTITINEHNYCSTRRAHNNN